MERPPQNDEEKGAVFIRTLFGEVSREYFPALSLADMTLNEAWRAAVKAEGGPFCYPEAERLMPF
jgi:hypothetical protein